MKKTYIFGLAVLLTGVFCTTGFSATFREEIRQLANQEEYTRARDILHEHLEENPGDNRARFWLARIYGWSGEYEPAIEQYELLLESEPGNYDYLLGKANTYYWKGQLEQALKLAREIRGKAPGYRAAYRLELRLLAAIGREETFEDLLREAQLRFEDFIAPVGPRLPSAPWDIKFKNRYSRLDSGFSGWTEHVLEVSRRSGGQFWQFRARKTDRFDRTDREISAQIGFEISEQWQARLEGSVNPPGRILPGWRVAAGGSYTGRSGRNLHFNFRRADYDGDRVNFIVLTPELYFGDWRLFYSLTRADNEEGGLNFSHRAGVDLYYGERSYAGLGFYTGDEVENGPDGDLLEMDVEGVYWRGSQQVGENWGLNYHFGYHSQGDQYDRSDYEIGVSYYF